MLGLTVYWQWELVPRDYWVYSQLSSLLWLDRRTHAVRNTGHSTTINIYARLCALLRRCLSMAKTFFHVFNLWFEMDRYWENVASSTGMSRRLQLDLWRTKFLLYGYIWAPAYSWSLPSKPKHYPMFYHPNLATFRYCDAYQTLLWSRSPSDRQRKTFVHEEAFIKHSSDDNRLELSNQTIYFFHFINEIHLAYCIQRLYCQSVFLARFLFLC